LQIVALRALTRTLVQNPKVAFSKDLSHRPVASEMQDSVPEKSPMMTNQTQTTKEDLTVRARAEFREMPGMCLTTAQAARLWQLSPARAEELLSELVQSGFLVRKEGQRYRLPSSV
jgi:hypothetical protein